MRRHRARRPDRQDRRAGDHRDGCRGGRASGCAETLAAPVTLTDRARRPAPVRGARHARRHQRRFGEIGLKPGSIGYARITTFTENTGGRARRRDRQDERSRRAAGSTASSSICATMPAGCSTQRSTSTGAFSTAASSSPRAAATATTTVSIDAPRGGGSVPRHAGRRADQQRLGVGRRDRRRRLAGPPPRHVMGSRSFGKGSVQSIIPIEGHGALRLTTALYYTPSGRSIQGNGIAPDIVVTLPKNRRSRTRSSPTKATSTARSRMPGR